MTEATEKIFKEMTLRLNALGYKRTIIIISNEEQTITNASGFYSNFEVLGLMEISKHIKLKEMVL